MVDWPASLPRTFSGDGSYQETPENTVLRSTMDTGVTKLRRRQTRSEATVTGNMVMTAAQAAAFINFFQVTTRGGSLSFGGWLGRSGTRQEYMFVEEPSVQHVGGDTYEVGLKLRILPQGPSSEPPSDPGGPVGTDPTGRSIPIAHAATHKSGGTDQIRLDELAQPLDSTALNASVNSHGLLPKLSGSSSTYLDGQGNWTAPAGGGGGGQSFTTIASPGVASVVADQPNDTLTLEGFGGVSIATTPASDTITLSPVYGTTFGTVCQGNDTRLSNARTPIAHASEHKQGGSDPIPIDELGQPGDNTLLNASTLRHGLLPKLNGNTSTYLNGSGAWTTPTKAYKTIKDFGAVGNGTTDDTAAIQSALDVSRGELIVPLGTYRVTSTLYIKSQLYLTGEGAAPFIGLQKPEDIGPGSWIHFDHLGKGIEIYLAPEPITVTGVMIKQLGFKRTQPTPGNTWVPNNNDFDIHVQTSRVDLHDLVLYNTARGILIDQYGHGLGKVSISKIRAHCFYNGIIIHRTYDLPVINEVHIWPLWTDHPAVWEFMKANLIGLLVYRADGLSLNSFFIIFANVGIAFGSATDAQGQGTHLRGQYTNVYLDLCRTCLVVDTAVTGQLSFQCANMVCTGESTNGTLFRIRGSNCEIDIDSLELGFGNATALSIEGTGNNVYIGRLRVSGWNSTGVSAPAVQVNSGNTLTLGVPALLNGGNGGPSFVGAGAIRVPSMVEQARG